MPASTNAARTAAGLLAAAVLLALAGCGSDKFESAEVDGKVTLGGKPLSGVKVAYYPVSEGREQPPYATGMTDTSGTYTLTLENGKTGALVGKNRVVVNWPLRERGSDRDKAPPPPPGPPIPIQYTVATETPLIVEVKSGGRQTIDLPLK
jgi:hypothetical protein